MNKFFYLFVLFQISSNKFIDYSPKQELASLKERIQSLERKRNVTLVKDVAQLTLNIILISGILYFIYQSYLRKD